MLRKNVNCIEINNGVVARGKQFFSGRGGGLWPSNIDVDIGPKNSVRS
jgi:hypothetical protein